MDWEKELKTFGLGMDRAKPNWLIYGHEHGDKTDHGSPEDTAPVSSYSLKKRQSARQKIRSAVWGIAPVTTERPEWGYVGGYTEAGKLVTVGPGKHKNRQVREEQACARLATKSRSKKSAT